MSEFMVHDGVCCLWSDDFVKDAVSELFAHLAVFLTVLIIYWYKFIYSNSATTTGGTRKPS